MSIFEPLTECGCARPDCWFCRMKGRTYTVAQVETIEKRKIIEARELHQILAAVCEASGVTIEQITGQSREEKVRIARQVFCYAARLQKWKDWQIGAAINRDRSTVVHSCGVVKTMLEMKQPGEYAVLASRLGIIPSINNHF